jgi:hypothetical protein
MFACVFSVTYVLRTDRERDAQHEAEPAATPAWETRQGCENCVIDSLVIRPKPPGPARTSAAREQLFGGIKRIDVNTDTTVRVDTIQRSGVRKVDVRIPLVQVGKVPDLERRFGLNNR